MMIIKRVQHWALAVLISIDQFFCVLLMGPKYVVFGGERPDPDETISSRVGRHARRGKLWAIVARLFINALFRVIAGQTDHCTWAIEKCDEARNAVMALHLVRATQP